MLRTIGDRIDHGAMTDAPPDSRDGGRARRRPRLLRPRGDLADATLDSPPLVLAGSPMDSTGFVSLAAGIPAGSGGRVLVLTDPRNAGRSTRDDDTAAVTPEQHAEDLHALIERARRRPRRRVRVLRCGGQLPLPRRRAPRRRTPPGGARAADGRACCPTALPSAGSATTCVADLRRRRHRPGDGAGSSGWSCTAARSTGDEPAPDPAMFGLPTEDDGSPQRPR